MKKKMTKAEKKFITDTAFALNDFYKGQLSLNIKRAWQRRKEREKVVHNQKLPCKQ